MVEVFLELIGTYACLQLIADETSEVNSFSLSGYVMTIFKKISNVDLIPTSLFKIALSGKVIRRSLIFALFFGTVLTSVNQLGAIMGRNPFNVLQLFLSFATPFVVVTVSQACGIRAAFRERTLLSEESMKKDSFIKVVLGHGIPRRAISIAVCVGTILTSVALFQSIFFSVQFSYALISEVYILPLVFGLFSQSFAYKRVVNSFGYSTLFDGKPLKNQQKS